MIREYKTREQILQAFREFFEWTYEVQFSAGDVSAIDDQILSGWSNTDESDLLLVKYIVHLHSLVVGAPVADAPKLRKQAQANLKVEFSRPASNDASRIVAQVHRAIEALRPKATGIPVITRAASPKQSASEAAVPPTGQQPGSPSSSAPIDIAGLKALIQQATQQVNASRQSMQAASQASMPIQPYIAQPLPPQAGPQALAPAQAMNQLNQALIQAAAPPPPPDPNDPREILARQMRIQHETMTVAMESAISKARHDSAMGVIKNIG